MTESISHSVTDADLLWVNPCHFVFTWNCSTHSALQHTDMTYSLTALGFCNKSIKKSAKLIQYLFFDINILRGNP